MKKIGIIGHFSDSLDGQTIKTKIYTSELKNIYSEEEVYFLNLHELKERKFYFISEIRKIMSLCSNIIIFPAHNAIRVLGPLLALLNIFFKRRLHYVVIGGWLPQFLSTRKWLFKSLLKFDHIYVETTTLKSKLDKMGFSSVVVVPNCKELHILSDKELKTSFAEPLPLCTLSRVNFKKGIEDAINVVSDINAQYGRTVFKLDIYGTIANDYSERFSSILKDAPAYIQYKGEVPFDKTVEVLKDYYALLFPTHYYTEGIPGTIIDSFAAGVPVISAKWESFSDVVDDNEVGIGYAFDKYQDLKNKLLYFVTNPNVLVDMRRKCLQRAKSFSTRVVIDKFIIFLK